MKRVGASLLVILVGCGKQDDAPRQQPGAADAGSVTAKPANQAAPDAAPPVSPVELSCRQLLARAWRSVQPTLARVGVEPAPIADGYLGDRAFLDGCVALTDEQRACLDAAADPIAGIHTCKVNEGKQHDRLYPPPVSSWNDPPPHDAARHAEVLADLTGTWRSEWKAAKQTQVWMIDAAGKIAQTVTDRNGKTETTSTRIEASRPDQLQLRTSSSSSQWYWAVRTGADTLYASSNLAYRAQRVPDDAKFVFAGHFLWALVDGATCEVITGNAEVIATDSCAWSETDGVRRLTITWKARDRIRTDGKPVIEELVLVRDGDFLLDQRLVDVGTFRRER